MNEKTQEEKEPALAATQPSGQKAPDLHPAGVPAPQQGMAEQPQPVPEADKDEEQVSVVYGGPHGRFQAAGSDMIAHGEPVQVARSLLQHLRAHFPGHLFHEPEQDK